MIISPVTGNRMIILLNIDIPVATICNTDDVDDGIDETPSVIISKHVSSFQIYYTVYNHLSCVEISELYFSLIKLEAQ